MAIASLVLGILWLFWIGSILAVIFGHTALHNIHKSNGRQDSKGIAQAGLILGWIGIATLGLVILLGACSSETTSEAGCCLFI